MPVVGVAAGADGSSMRNIWSSHLYSHRHRLSHILERNFPCGLGGTSRAHGEESPPMLLYSLLFVKGEGGC